MVMKQDGVEVLCLPDEANCMLDEDYKSPLEMMECPLGNIECDGDCFYYREEKKNRIQQ